MGNTLETNRLGCALHTGASEKGDTLDIRTDRLGFCLNVVVVVVALSLLARIWGECSTIYSAYAPPLSPPLFFFQSED